MTTKSEQGATMTDSKAKMLERVRALLAKAADTEFPAEADAFRAKADELMARYAIEQWQVDAAQAGVGKRAEPVSRDIDMAWYVGDAQSEYIWQMMQTVAQYVRVQLVYWRYNTRRMPVVGLESDIDYFDLLFTHLMLQFSKNLEPKPDPDKPMIDNLVRMKEAGMKWERIGELLYQVGQLDAPYTRNTGVRFTKLYSTYCKEQGRPQLRTSPSVYQRSFAVGFISGLRERLQTQEKAYKGSGMELAIRDIRQANAQAATDMFGYPRQTGRAVSKSYKVDYAAVGHGKDVGRKAEIISSAQTRVGGSKGEIGS